MSEYIPLLYCYEFAFKTSTVAENEAEAEKNLASILLSSKSFAEIFTLKRNIEWASMQYDADYLTNSSEFILTISFTIEGDFSMSANLPHAVELYRHLNGLERIDEKLYLVKQSD